MRKIQGSSWGISSLFVNGIVVAVAAALLAFGSGPLAHAAPVTIADDGLRACVNEKLNQGADDEITETQAASITELGCNNLEISSLAGIGKLTGLKYLWLEGNKITDLSPLVGLTSLGHLYLKDNSIADVTPLSKLTSVSVLDLSRNALVDLSPVSELPLFYIDASRQRVDLGTLTIGSPVKNPLIDFTKGVVALDDPRYDAASNTFTPTGTPGQTTPLTWSTAPDDTDSVFSGELIFTLVAASTKPTPSPTPTSSTTSTTTSQPTSSTTPTPTPSTTKPPSSTKPSSTTPTPSTTPSTTSTPSTTPSTTSTTPSQPPPSTAPTPSTTPRPPRPDLPKTGA